MNNNYCSRLLTRLLFLGLLAVSTTWAQPSHGYLFVAPGGASDLNRSTIHLGAGGEFIVPAGIGIGAEIGALGPTSNFSDVLGVFSANGYYHFLRNGGKTDAFGTAGYSLFFRSGTANLFNFGGGVNYWFLSRIGFRFEFRDHVTGDAAHFWGIRFGLAFR
jgi:hypothetical protein